MNKTFLARPVRACSIALCRVLIVLGASAIQAQELNPVVISAARLEQSLSDVLPSVSVITRQDIDKSQAASLADLVQGEAGLEFGRNGGPGATTSFFLRGQNSQNVVLLVDGVRAQTDGIGALQITDVPLSQVERIEILRGNASALYGEAAIGGVIQVFTRQGRGVPQAYGSVSAGSRNSWGWNAGYGGTVGDNRFDINAGKTASEGFSAMNPTQRSGVNPDKDGYTSEFASAKFERNINANLVVGLRLSSRLSKVDTDDRTGVTDTHLFQQKNEVIGAFLRHAVTDQWSTQLDIASAKLNYLDAKNGVLYAAGDGSYKNGRFNGQQNTLRWSNQMQIQSGTVLTFGADSLRENFAAVGDYAYNMERKTTGLFAGLTQKLDKLTAQLNVRHDEVNVVHNDVWNATANQNKITTGLFGLGYQMAPQWRLTATASTGFRAPTASDVSSNPLLKPETHQSREAGVVYSSADTLARLVYFSTATRDAIDFDANYNVLNIGETRNQGLEATLRALWWGNRIRMTAVSQDPWSVSYNEPLARRAKTYASVDVSRSVGEFELGVKAYAAGQRKDSHYSPGVNLGGYALWSLYASRKMDENWTLRLRLDNAFDKQYQLAYGYNTPGRGLFATLQYSPK